MKDNNKGLYNRVRYSLIHIDNNNGNLNHDQLFTLYDSVINNQPKKKNSIFKINYNINNNYSINDYKEKNLISQIVKDKVNLNKYHLFNHNNNKHTKPNNFINNKDYKTFITNTQMKGNITKSKENKKVIHVGKSLNDILIKNINDEMINKGILIQRSFSSRKFNKSDRNIRNQNYNNYETHMELFDQKLKKEFVNYIKEYKLADKKTLRSVSKKIADKKEKITKNIPIYIKGFRKNPIDIFHSRKIFDLEYQKLYNKPCVNIEEILHYQNKNGTNDFKKGKIPFYYFLRTVNNPYDKKKKIIKRPKSGKIFIEFKTSDNE